MKNLTKFAALALATSVLTTPVQAVEIEVGYAYSSLFDVTMERLIPEFKKAHPKTKKKYEVKISFQDKNMKPKIVRFGSLQHQHYKDRIGLFKHLDHADDNRRKSFHARFGKLIKKNSKKYSLLHSL